jgi:hypothetical protein
MDSDLSPEQMRLHIEKLRRMTGAERFRLMGELTEAWRASIQDELRREFPNASPEELRIRFGVRLYGREEMKKHFGSVPDDAQ